LVFDLREDPAALMDLDPETIRQRLFTPVRDLPEGVARIPIKTVRMNHCPMLASLATLTPEAGVRWRIDPEGVARHAEVLRATPAVAEKLREVRRAEPETTETDPDFALYRGGFFSDPDRREIARVHGLPPEALGSARFTFRDQRLPELLFRYRARNWPETLTDAERERWETFRRRRLTDPAGGAGITIAAYRERIGELRAQHAEDPARLGLLAELDAWADRLGVD
jgi:exodeoxyribonuclease-1